MKVGIFTFPNSTSYGAVLQMYALYRSVEKLGHTADIINYQNAFMKADKHIQGNAAGRSAVKRRISTLLHAPLYRAFRKFERRHMQRYPAAIVEDSQRLSQIGQRYDAVICGSDQVWNPDITGNDLSYFLNFCSPSTRRISYAPSFGIDSFSEAFCNAIREELKQFTALSVRETPGQVLLRSLLCKEVPLVADPTFLLSESEWAELERPHSAGKGEYILYYTIRRSSQLQKKCRELSRETGLPVVIVGGNPLTKWKNRDPMVRYAVDCSPEQWLYLMRHARYVVTNSFHGTAFSVNFRKDFYVEFSSLTNSRLSHIVETLGLSHRVVSADAKLCASTIDYNIVSPVLQSICDDSRVYLQNALQEEPNG